MTLNFNAENLSFSKILGNGIRYIVPRFQRDYSWEEEQWEDLWADIIAEDPDATEHYMGYLVLSMVDNHTFNVIDGQQRLTTITTVILAILRELRDLAERGVEPEENLKRLETLKNIYIGFTDPETLQNQPKLQLNQNNNSYFRRYICGFEKPRIRNIKKSERLLSEAFSFFAERVAALEIRSGQELAAFVRKITDKLIFTTITVSSELNAYKVFETLNARGVKLSTPDLIKNYLFSVIDSKDPLDEHRLRDLEEQWGIITNQLGKLDFTKFIFAEWNSRNPSIHKQGLFKKIKADVSSKDNAFAYLRQLEEASEVYAALNIPSDSFWQREGYYKAVQPLKTLELFNITQPQGVLLAAYSRYDPEKFCKIAQYLEVVSVRYNIIGRMSPNVQERVYNQLARQIHQGEISNLQAIKSALQKVYPEDGDFSNAFASKHMPTDQTIKKVRYLLARLEEFISHSSTDDLALSLEHVLPVRPSSEWLLCFDSAELDDYSHRLGNMTLLPDSTNKQLKNKTFAQKKAAYAASPLQITQKCAEYDEWTPEAIAARQKWLADIATRCWKIDF